MIYFPLSHFGDSIGTFGHDQFRQDPSRSTQAGGVLAAAGSVCALASCAVTCSTGAGAGGNRLFTYSNDMTPAMIVRTIVAMPMAHCERVTTHPSF